MPRTPLCGTSLHPQCRKINVKGAGECLVLTSVAHCCTLNALSDGLEVSLSEGVSVRGWTLPSAVARKRRVSSGLGERGHPRPRQREGPDGYEFCGAGRSRHWEGWSRRSRRNRAETTRIPPLTSAEGGRRGYKKGQTGMVCPFYVDSQRLTTLLLEPLQQLPEPLLQPQP
jgi:hypothetical protein